jgi:uncharacterized protein YndB with AHSA1/START domain
MGIIISASIVIERPPQAVWAFFTEAAHWKEWRRYGLSSAEWHPGGELHTEPYGGRISVLRSTPEKSIRLQSKGSFTLDSAFTFESREDGRSTQVAADEDYSGVSFTDGGEGKRSDLRADLAKLKDLIEHS